MSSYIQEIVKILGHGVMRFRLEVRWISYNGRQKTT